MATTGYWPVKSRLKDVLSYAENPDKTTEKTNLDDDLKSVIEYAAKDNKTDKKMYVTGINCLAPIAYERMKATKKHFGKEGGNVAYHGFQSFVKGEVSAEEAHQIGIETAKKMWGDEYEILVTTHLNTENFHNHIVVNSVSFKTGRKFENHQSDHIKLREISDEVCRQRGKNVLDNSQFYKKDKNEYWIHKAGKLSRRDILRMDIDMAVEASSCMAIFEDILHAMGYRYARGKDYKRPSLLSDGWERAIRFDSLGNNYSLDKIRERINERESDYGEYVTAIRIHKLKPLTILEKELAKTRSMNDIEVIFYLFTTMLKLLMGVADKEAPKARPLSPMMRAELAKLDKHLEHYQFITANNIHSINDLSKFIVEKTEDSNKLYNLRKTIDNKIRRASTEANKDAFKAERREISSKLKPLRKDIKIAKEILISIPKIKELLNEEKISETNISREKKRDAR